VSMIHSVTTDMRMFSTIWNQYDNTDTVNGMTPTRTFS